MAGNSECIHIGIIIFSGVILLGVGVIMVIPILLLLLLSIIKFKLNQINKVRVNNCLKKLILK